MIADYFSYSVANLAHFYDLNKTKIFAHYECNKRDVFVVEDVTPFNQGYLIAMFYWSVMCNAVSEMRGKRINRLNRQLARPYFTSALMRRVLWSQATFLEKLTFDGDFDYCYFFNFWHYQEISFRLRLGILKTNPKFYKHQMVQM